MRRYLIELYVSKIKIIANRENKLAEELSSSLEELGYFIVNEKPDALVFFYPIGITVRKIKDMLKGKLRDPVVISVTDDGSYVIPVIKEHWGGSFLGNLIADLLGSQLVLTSRTAQLGLYSVEEFAWINALRILNPRKILEVEKKLVKERTLNVYSQIKLQKLEGYEFVEDCKEADITVGYECGSPDKLNMQPYSVIVGLGYSSNVPKEALYYSIKATLKSIFISETRLDFIVVPDVKKDDPKVKEVAKAFSSSVIYVPLEELKGKPQSTPSEVARKFLGVEGVCEPSIGAIGGDLVLKRTKRAYGVVTCLGVKQITEGSELNL